MKLCATSRCHLDLSVGLRAEHHRLAPPALQDNHFTAVDPFRSGYSNYISMDLSNNHINATTISVPSKLLTELSLAGNR